MKKINLLILLFSISFYLQSQTAVKDLQYVNDGKQYHRLDVYVPANVSEKRPLVVYIHGGGWIGGAKGGGMNWFKAMNDAGYICADINYRLSTDSVWPAQLYDCKAAIRYLKANAALYNIDTCRIGVMGSSAGGHLTSILATTGNYSVLEGGHLGNTQVSSKVNAALPVFGPTDFLQMDGFYPPNCTNPAPHSYNSPETKLIGCDSLKNCLSKVNAVNPITYIDKYDPPFYITHGNEDCTVPQRQSQLLDSALRANGINTKMVIANGEGHGGPFWTQISQQGIYKSFFDTALKVCINTGVQYKTATPAINLYPNPTLNGRFTITTDDAIEKIQVFDAFGRLLFTGNSTNGNATFDISLYPKGLYTITLAIGNKNYKQLLVVQ